MNTVKWIAALTLASVLGTGMAAAAEKKVVGVSIPAADHGWTAGIVYHANAAAKEIQAAYPDVEVVVKTSPSATAQVSAIEDLQAARKMDALVILPHTSEELTTPVAAIKDQGVFITVVDRGLNDPSIQDLYVAGDNIAVGRNTAKFLVEKLGGKGNLVVLRGIPTVIDNERIQGFEEGIAGSDLKILDIQYANWNSDEAFKLMQDYLAKYPSIDAVWANDDDMLLGVLEAIKQSGRTEIKYALGGNGMKDIIEKVMAGDPMTPVETPYPPSMIKTAIYLTVDHLVGNVPARGFVKLDAPLITQENAEEYYFPDSPF
jgi:ribose transport system substrate-binding protein